MQWADYRKGAKRSRYDLSAEQVAAAYKLRWDIENFFARWKRHMKVTNPIAEGSSTTELPDFPKDLILMGTQTLETPLAIEALRERLGIGQIFRDI